MIEAPVQVAGSLKPALVPNVVATIGIFILALALAVGVLAVVPGTQLKAWADSLAADGDVQMLTPRVLVYLKIALAFCSLAGALTGALLVRRRAWIADALRESGLQYLPSGREGLLGSFRRGTEPEQRVNVLCLAGLLLAGFWGGYLTIGLRLAASGEMEHYDALFASDPPRVIRDIAKPGADGGRSSVHPLFVLFVNPLGSALGRLLHSNTSAAVLLTSLAGGLCVAVALLVFVALGLPTRLSLLFSLFLGFSTTQLVFGSQPDTFLFGALALELMVLLVVFGVSEYHLIIPAVAAFGITSTNLIPAALLRIGHKRTSMRAGFLNATLLILAAIIVAIAFLGVQRKLYPRSESFLDTSSYGEGVFRYTAVHDTQKVFIHRVKEELYSFLLYDFVAPTIYVRELGQHFQKSLLPIPRYTCDRVCRSSLTAAGKVSLLNKHPPHLTFEAPGFVPAYPVAGWLAAAIWSALILAAAWKLAFAPSGSLRLVTAVAAAVAFNFLLHLIYGDDMFLYSAHYTFLILLLVVLGLREFWNTRWLQVAVSIAIVLSAVHNLSFIHDALLIFG